MQRKSRAKKPCTTWRVYTVQVVIHLETFWDPSPAPPLNILSDFLIGFLEFYPKFDLTAYL